MNTSDSSYREAEIEASNSKETLRTKCKRFAHGHATQARGKRSWIPVLMMIVIMCGVWLYNGMRKVDVELTALVETQQTMDGLQALALTFVDADEEQVLEKNIIMSKTHLTARTSITLKPGTYQVRAMFLFENGNNRLVNQTIVVPEYDAQMDIYLRP